MQNKDSPKPYVLPWLKNETTEFFEQLKKHGTRAYYKKNSVIINQGETVNRFYFINHGLVRVVCLTELGEERLFWYSGPKTIFGEVPFLCKLPCHATIIADKDCEVYIHNEASFQKIIECYPSVTRNLINFLAYKIQILTSTIHDFYNNPEERVCKLIYALCLEFGTKTIKGIELSFKVSHKDIGFITGLHRVTVTNVLLKMKKQGIIETPARGKLIVINLQKLKNCF